MQPTSLFALLVFLVFLLNNNVALATKRPAVVTSGTTMGQFVRSTGKPTAKCPRQGRALDAGKVSKEGVQLLYCLSTVDVFPHLL